MPYQVKVGTLIIFAETASEALAIFEASTRDKSDITILDPSGGADLTRTESRLS
jgi:hypothetical protein